jgi:hypothetical protein
MRIAPVGSDGRALGPRRPHFTVGVGGPRQLDPRHFSLRIAAAIAARSTIETLLLRKLGTMISRPSGRNEGMNGRVGSAASLVPTKTRATSAPVAATREIDIQLFEAARGAIVTSIPLNALRCQQRLLRILSFQRSWRQGCARPVSHAVLVSSLGSLCDPANLALSEDGSTAYVINHHGTIDNAGFGQHGGRGSVAVMDVRQLLLPQNDGTARALERSLDWPRGAKGLDPQA